MSDNFRLIDTHAHVDFEDFELSTDKILEKCKQNHVEKIIVPGVTFEDLDRVISTIEKYDNLYGAAGIHPSEAKSWTEGSYEKLKEYALHPKVVGIGETGLDYYWDKTFNDQQQFVFKEQIRLAKEVNKPLIIHDREAHGDILNILKETNASEIGGVMHCFSGSYEFAMECIKLNFHIALGGPVTFKNAHKPKEVAEKIPLEKLVLETDSPFLTPHPFRGQQNDPSKVLLVAETIAELRGLTIKQLADATTANAQKLFKV